MIPRVSARNESFARTFTPHDPSRKQETAGLTLSHPQGAGCCPDSAQKLTRRSSAQPSHRVNYSPDIIGGGQNMGLKKPKSIKHNGKSLADILEAHERFFSGKDGGVRADLTGADLSHADLSGGNFTGAILRNANLEGSDLRKAKLPGADLTEAQASGVEFFRCDLSNVNFQRARLRNVNLRLANVNGARFSGADMGVAILRETDLTGADLSGVDLSTTLMPKGFSAAQVAKKSA